MVDPGREDANSAHRRRAHNPAADHRKIVGEMSVDMVVKGRNVEVPDHYRQHVAEKLHKIEQPWHIVREKEHKAEPMTVDDALFQMELVGHDFYLFLDKESGKPSVVYRRHAYDYGVIALAA